MGSAWERMVEEAFAAPPQLDVYLNIPFSRTGQSDEPHWITLEEAAAMPGPG
jgi:hypothetical protein